MRMLMIGTHCDDVELGIGGYLSKAIRTKEVLPKDVCVLIMSSGDTLMRHGGIVTRATRESEAKNAMAKLKVSNVIVMDFPENRLDTEPLENLMNVISDVIERWGPDEIYAPLPGFNQDHRMVHDALIASLRPTKPMIAKRVWLYEYTGDSMMGLTTMSLPAWGWRYIVFDGFDMRMKLGLCAEHLSQFNRPSKSHLSLDAVEKLAILRGSECCADWAERVLLLREVYK